MSQTTPPIGRRQPTGRRGRPPLPDGEKCSRALLVRLRPVEHEQLRAAAALLGESLSEFVTTASLRRAEEAGSDLCDITK